MVNKKGEVIASAVTNLDLHDIARAARTFGVGRFFVVTPLADQKHLVERIVSHWQKGAGAAYNPDRREALATIRLAGDLEEVLERLARQTGERPAVVATTCRRHEDCVDFAAVRAMLGNGRPLLLLFGTAWGLAPGLLEKTDFVLAPVEGPADYNHLSVRSAAAIILDRLLSREPRHQGTMQEVTGNPRGKAGHKGAEACRQKVTEGHRFDLPSTK